MKNIFQKKAQEPLEKPGKKLKMPLPKSTKVLYWIVGVLGGLAALSLVAVIVINLIMDHYLDKINYVTNETDLIFATEVISSEEVYTALPPPVSTNPDISLTLPLTAPPTEDHHGEVNGGNLPLICDTEYVTNILLLGTDNRDAFAGRTDVMMLVSINEKTKDIVLCSFMRDLLVLYPESPKTPVSGRYTKLNAAHSYGGPQLVMDVMKLNFNIDIDYYAKVDFKSFVPLVDAFGGLNMNLSKAEVEYINGNIMGGDEYYYLFPNYPNRTILEVKDGVQRLNGLQALAHARNRSSTLGSDWDRTNRQRTLISQMMVQAKDLSLSQLDNLLDTVLPLITTNMPKNMLKEMVGDALSFLKFDVTSTRVPQNGKYYEDSDWNIIADLPANCRYLYEKIYGEKAK